LIALQQNSSIVLIGRFSVLLVDACATSLQLGAGAVGKTQMAVYSVGCCCV
jgi:hypothetical protein